jgi:hypothetical protein
MIKCGKCGAEDCFCHMDVYCEPCKEFLKKKIEHERKHENSYNNIGVYIEPPPHFIPSFSFFGASSPDEEYQMPEQVILDLYCPSCNIIETHGWDWHEEYTGVGSVVIISEVDS